jgi:hypothetical protein
LYLQTDRPLRALAGGAAAVSVPLLTYYVNWACAQPRALF